MKMSEYFKSVEAALNVCGNQNAQFVGKDLKILASIIGKSLGVYKVDEAEEFLRFPDARNTFMGMGYSVRQTAVIMRSLAQSIPILSSVDQSMSPAKIRRLAYEKRTGERKYVTVSVVGIRKGETAVPTFVTAKYRVASIPYKKELMRRLN